MNNVKDLWCHFKNSDDDLYNSFYKRIEQIKETNKDFIINCILMPRVVREDLKLGILDFEGALFRAECMFEKALEKNLLDELYQIKE